jgi:hypothetical protein
VADHYRIIKELEEERRQLNRAIHALEQIEKNRKSAAKKIRQGAQSAFEEKDGTTGKVVPFIRRFTNKSD